MECVTHTCWYPMLIRLEMSSRESVGRIMSCQVKIGWLDHHYYYGDGILRSNMSPSVFHLLLPTGGLQCSFFTAVFEQSTSLPPPIPRHGSVSTWSWGGLMEDKGNLRWRIHPCTLISEAVGRPGGEWHVRIVVGMWSKARVEGEVRIEKLLGSNEKEETLRSWD